MSTYLFHGFHTPETLARLLAAPEDRAAVIAPLLESLGGELLGLIGAPSRSPRRFNCSRKT